MDTSTELEAKILEDFLHYFLPDGLLAFFEPVMAEDKEHQIKKDEVYKRELHLYFDERDNRTPEMQNLRPNGFTEERTISGFLVWAQRPHADSWVLLPENLGTHLSIDESSLHDTHEQRRSRTSRYGHRDGPRHEVGGCD